LEKKKGWLKEKLLLPFEYLVVNFLGYGPENYQDNDP
jgi:hypothetical protein